MRNVLSALSVSLLGGIDLLAVLAVLGAWVTYNALRSTRALAARLRRRSPQ